MARMTNDSSEHQTFRVARKNARWPNPKHSTAQHSTPPTHHDASIHGPEQLFASIPKTTLIKTTDSQSIFQIDPRLK
jgi:hypothetical protein